jgi:hypothetical protein
MMNRFGHAGALHHRATIAAKIAGYDHGNLTAARIILAERQRYEKECRLLVSWALAVIRRLGTNEERQAA